MIGSTLLRRMDEAGTLGFDVWDFSLRSLARRYGRIFLASVVLRHPWRTFRGLRDYRRRTRRARQEGAACVGVDSLDALAAGLSTGDWLVGIGFCQKPLDPPCPSGRFNHRCWLLAQAPGASAPPACQACQVRELARYALPAGASVHIMTSAADLARDLLLPALRGEGPSRVVLSLCPYSVAPMTLALTICGIRGVVLSYSEGHCGDFAAWVRADEGDKPERTFLRPDTHQRLRILLDEVAQARAESGQPAASRFREQGNLYVPGEAASLDRDANRQ